jgi:hypothetical protein
MSRPNLSYLKNIILAIFGIPCGILTGLTGISNTYFASPMLSKMIGASGARLIGSTLAIATFSALTGLLAYGQMHAVNFVLAPMRRGSLCELRKSESDLGKSASSQEFYLALS